jgi:hypothetical protein
MSLLTVVQGVCAVVGVSIPTSSVFTNINSNRTMQEMLALANEMAQRIAYDAGRDWGALKKSALLLGADLNPDPDITELQTAFPLPSDYKRMLLTSQVWRSTSTQQPMRFVSDTDEWMQRRASNENEAWGEWAIHGGEMHIWPGMPVGTSATFAYLNKNCIALASGGYGDTFMADTDSYRLNERLLRLGMIYQWKANKGSPYAEDMGSFSDALAMEMGHDKPSPIIVGRVPLSHTARVSSSWPVGWGPVA